jgi:hypothetical protein
MRLRASASILYFIALISTKLASGQFAPAAGYPGSTAFPKDSSVFVEWANSCFVQRGYMDIAVPDSGYASAGNSNSAVGQAGQNGTVSLGDGGVVTLTFNNMVYNGPGFDFAVFENGFYTTPPLAFLEFAFVEVSSDGNNFYRFPATSYIQDTSQLPMTGVDCSFVNNLAGKFVYGYGTPFDLEELKNEVGLDVNNISHVRVVDVVGSINDRFATFDQFAHKINDPYATPFPSGGFDLDAVGVIHAVGVTNTVEIENSDVKIRVYPVPCSRDLGCIVLVDASLIGAQMEVYGINGERVENLFISNDHSKIDTQTWTKGIYYLIMEGHVSKLLVE